MTPGRGVATPFVPNAGSSAPAGDSLAIQAGSPNPLTSRLPSSSACSEMMNGVATPGIDSAMVRS